MKAERINKNQIRFTLNKADLQARQLKLADLSYGSDKTKALFDDMMQQALVEFGFDASSGKPLMIEAIPTSDESLMITVTQVNSHEDLMAMFRSNFADVHLDAEPSDPAAMMQEETPPEAKETVIVYTFAAFKDLLAASRLLSPSMRLRNQLYHDEGDDGAYYLMLRYNRLNGQIRYTMMLLTEYAAGVDKDPLWISHIEEHARLMIRARALQKLSAMENA